MKKIALVTGGSGGIGSAVCRSLASLGWAVGVGYFRNQAGATCPNRRRWRPCSPPPGMWSCW